MFVGCQGTPSHFALLEYGHVNCGIFLLTVMRRHISQFCSVLFYAGTCINREGTFLCSCEEGFVGENCQTNIDDCNPMPCLNGATCQDKINAFQCICPPGLSFFSCFV